MGTQPVSAAERQLQAMFVELAAVARQSGGLSARRRAQAVRRWLVALSDWCDASSAACAVRLGLRPDQADVVRDAFHTLFLAAERDLAPILDLGSARAA